jgi:hypothetical protein
VIKAQAIEVHLPVSSECPAGISTKTNNCETSDDLPPTIINVPWSASTFAEVKGVVHSPSPRPTMKLETREALLSAIAKARVWIDHLVEGRIGSVGEIATREGKVERHIRLPAPLAFVSPRVISAVMDGTAPRGLTVTGLAQPLAYMDRTGEASPTMNARVPTHQPVSCDVEPSLWHRNLDIENCRPETDAQNWPIAADNPENYASETA